MIWRNIQPRFQANIHKEKFSLSKIFQNPRASHPGSKSIWRDWIVRGLLLSWKDWGTRKSIHLRGKDFTFEKHHNLPRTIYITLSALDLEKRKLPYKRSWKNKAEAENSPRKTKLMARLRIIKRKRARMGRTCNFLNSISKQVDRFLYLVLITLKFSGTSENIYADGWRIPPLPITKSSPGMKHPTRSLVFLANMGALKITRWWSIISNQRI